MGTNNNNKHYRWILIFYHAGEEHSRIVDDTWYDSSEKCQQAADALDFDLCCGYDFEYECRVKPECLD